MECKEWVYGRMWEWRDSNGVIHLDEIEKVLWMEKRKLPHPVNRVYGKRAGSHKLRKGHPSMEKSTDASN